MAELIFQIITFVSSIATLILFFQEFKRAEKGKMKYLRLVVGILMGIVAILSVTYFNEVNPRIRAREYYERYSQISFENNFPGTKIKSPLTDGIVIMKDLNFDEEYPELYEPIISRYNTLATEEFNHDKHVELCREIFGALGSYSKLLYTD